MDFKLENDMISSLGGESTGEATMEAADSPVP